MWTIKKFRVSCFEMYEKTTSNQFKNLHKKLALKLHRQKLSSIWIFVTFFAGTINYQLRVFVMKRLKGQSSIYNEITYRIVLHSLSNYITTIVTKAFGENAICKCIAPRAIKTDWGCNFISELIKDLEKNSNLNQAL